MKIRIAVFISTPEQRTASHRHSIQLLHKDSPLNWKLCDTLIGDVRYKDSSNAQRGSWSHREIAQRNFSWLALMNDCFSFFRECLYMTLLDNSIPPWNKFLLVRSCFLYLFLFVSLVGREGGHCFFLLFNNVLSRCCPPPQKNSMLTF